MFDHIGSKIKSLAEVLTAFGFGASVLGGVVLGVESVWIGLLVAAVGCAASWIGSFFMYGFGQLIENTDILVKQHQHQVPQQVEKPAVSRVASTHNFCMRCGKQLQANICFVCYGERLELVNQLRQSGTITEEEYREETERMKSEL